MDLRIAVLIDGDNIPFAHVKEMLEEIAKYGNPTIKRILISLVYEFQNNSLEKAHDQEKICSKKRL